MSATDKWWKDPGRWFAALICFAVIFAILSVQLKHANPALATASAYAFGATVLGMIVLGLWMIVAPIIEKLRDKDERRKLFADVIGKIAGWVILGVVGMIICGVVWIVEDYRSGTKLLRVPGFGDWMAASRLRDWPSVLGEQARDISVDRCDRSNRGFICFLKKLDADGAYRTIPCYYDGALAKTWPANLPISIEAFCSATAQP